MKAKRFTIDSSVITTKKLVDFSFAVDENMKRESICATIKEYMNDINPKYAIYVSPKIWDVEAIQTFKEIKEILEKTIKPPKDDSEKP